MASWKLLDRTGLAVLCESMKQIRAASSVTASDVSDLQSDLLELSRRTTEALSQVDNTLEGMLPDCELITLAHNLDAYPKVLVLLYEYGAGSGGAGDGPAGGTNAITVNNRIEYLNRNQIKIYTPQSVAAQEKTKTVNKISDHEYTITTDDTPDCIYIRLILI